MLHYLILVKKLAALSLVILVGYFAAESQVHTVKGKLVDTQNLPAETVPVKVKCGSETVNTVRSNRSGDYAAEFPLCLRSVTVIYGDSNYYPSDVASLSGRTSHSITKILRLNDGTNKLTPAEASEILGVLEFFQTDIPGFKEEIIEWAGAFSEERFPPEFRSRLREFEKSAAKIMPKEYQRERHPGLGAEARWSRRSEPIEQRCKTW